MSTTHEVLLLQPRHVYAPPASIESLGHVYMPTSLLAAGARLVDAGVRVTVVDENISVSREMPDVVGINLVGAPYVGAAIELARRFRRDKPTGHLLLGGAVISGFSDEQRQRLFGLSTDGNNDREIEERLGLREGTLRPPEATSLVPAYELLSDDAMHLYLRGEFAFYLSQGCKFSCSFCAAKRTRLLPKYIPVRERYRNITVVENDLRYLFRRAESFGLNSLSLYLTNLDLFQTPSELVDFAEVVLRVRRENPEISLRMRALTNVGSFLDVHQKDPSLIWTLTTAGLSRLGFGIDGATPAVWRAVRKPHRTATSCVDAIRISKEVYGITPEALMVFGHGDADTTESLELAVDFVSAMADQYGAIPRPHVAKSVVPGNDGWNDPSNARAVELLLSNPALFQVLDFVALPSTLTHPDDEFRRLVSRAFLDVCKISGNVTQFVLPEDPFAPENEMGAAKAFNLGRYDV